jgi:pimeloyl-ACP methyl ester carboxylesterase
LFEIPRAGHPPSEFYALPFPNDLRITETGAIDLSDHMRLGNLVDTYLELIGEETKGFGTNSAAFFRFSGPIDPSTLPTTPEDAMSASASVYLVDVTPGPELHRRWPVRFRFEGRAGRSIGDNWLSVLPFPGSPLRGGRTYAVVVTRRLRAAGNAEILPSTDFAAILASGLADADVTRARQVYGRLLDVLDEPGGDERADVISAAVFTTQQATELMGKLRQVSVAAPAPSLVAGTLAKADRTGFTEFTGQYSNHPNFQSGDPPYMTTGGEILVDENGMPIIDHFETLRFAVTIPDGTMPASGWPVVLYAHGTGGSYRSFINDGTAGNLALEGLAVISIDQVLHGPRDPTGSDPDLTFFNFMNPVAARDNVRQGAADDFTLLRFVKTLSIVDGAVTNSFDSDKMYFMGHSQGGLTGPPFLAYEPEVKGAILSGAGGLLYESLLTKTQPIDITGLVSILIGDDPLDEFNNILALVQMFIEAGDPVNYGPLLVRETDTPKAIFQTEGIGDSYATPVTIESLSVAISAEPVTPVLHAVPGALSPLIPPVTNNINGHTSVLLQYDPPPGEDGHFVVFDVPAALKQSRRFLGTLSATGTAMVVAP